MQREHFIALGGAFFLTLLVAAFAQAATVVEIWRSVFSSADNAIRVVSP